jgi:hypothetical protein
LFSFCKEPEMAAPEHRGAISPLRRRGASLDRIEQRNQ